MTDHARPRPLDSIEALEQVLAASAGRPQLLFKHSDQCPISGGALQALLAHLQQPASDVDYWLTVVQTQRAVSAAIERRLGVRHETPQAILVSEGRPLWNASHHRITADSLAAALAAPASA